MTRRGEYGFNDRLRCGDCGTEVPRPTPGLFSFNTPFGACPRCRGFGRVIDIDWSRVVPDPRLSIRDGAIRPWQTERRRGRMRRCLNACAREGIPTDVPWGELTERQRRFVLEGGGGGWDGARGFFRNLETKKYRMHVRVLLSRYRGYFTCPDCGGSRLRPEAAAFRIGARTLPELWKLPVRDVLVIVESVLAERLERTVRLLAEEIASRLRYLESVGLGYLTLDRQSRTLSGGEVERVNLTAALGASLVDTLFVLDEPSVGLHARDNDRLLGILERIRDRGNTVVVVEHDPAILSAADHLIDMGPGSGSAGGRIVARGAVEEVARARSSLTGDYLAGRRRMPRPPERRRTGASGHLRVRGARQNNLQGIDVDIPLDRFTAISGVSGSGKSSLVNDVIWRRYLAWKGRPVEGDVRVDRIDGFDGVEEVVLVDQSPIGRTPRGNPATYTKAFDAIRKLIARSPDARRLGLDASSFSFNAAGGRCEECGGAGAIQVEMQFLSDVSLPCEACGGRRFRAEVLRARYRGRNVHEILELTIREALDFFGGEPALQDKLSFLDSLGIGYLRLGQPINTLSGGEAQRLKLAGRVLSARRGRLLFLIDEPTTGLHLDDVRNLIRVLHDLVLAGHGVVVIEHHLDVIAAADHVIDLGPEGGDGGGRVVATGRPEDLAGDTRSITGRWLRRHLEESASSASPAGDPLPGRGNGRRGGRKGGGRRSGGRGRGRSLRGGARAGDARNEPSRPRASAGNGRGSARERQVIRVVGARENNLKDLTVELPRNRLVVVTGLSGAGKSSLVYDIVFSEGQRRYLDCLSPYARQFVEDLHRPDIDHLEGIPPAVAIEQRTTIGGRKSTVGTVTEIYHFLRLLFARAGVQLCPQCGIEVAPRALGEIREEIARRAADGGWLLAPVVRAKKGFHSRLLASARRRGISEARIDGRWVRIPEDRELRLERNRAHDIDLVVARFGGRDLEPESADRALDRALDLGGGVVRFRDAGGRETLFNLRRSCPSCGIDFDEPDPRNFSFHSRHGMCLECAGRGVRLEPDPERLIERWDLPLEHHPDGPLAVLDAAPFGRGARRRFLRELEGLGGTPADGRPLASWGRRALRTLLHGKPRNGFGGLLGLVRETVGRLDDADREWFLTDHGREVPCEACRGSRLAEPWSSVRVGGFTIAELARRTVAALRATLQELEPEPRSRPVTEPVLSEIDARLEFLEGVGLHYISLDRGVHTLSGGEAQRIRLGAQLGSNLRGACYILDEPTIGLHSRDNDRLLATLRDLRDRGNSVIVIEHDDATIEAADEVLELGPGPGRHGGEVVVQGTLADLEASHRSPTGEYFRSRATRVVELSSDRLEDRDFLEIEGACLHNLKDVDARLPLGCLTVVTGVSGAGKSTLVRDVLEESVYREFRGLRGPRPGSSRVRAAELLDGVREVDQQPIGRTMRSTPATYVGFWGRIRALFASVPEARARGYAARRFSFNTPGGRCEACRGQGRIRMEMNFLPDVTVDCEACEGRRFNPETLEITYRGKSIGDVLAMSVEEALELFSSYRDLRRPLQALSDLGLGYLTLGQASTTLSGGEAQRVKLAVELAKTARGAWLYLFDEPTTGLHMKDVARLVDVLRRLASGGHAVVVVEHNLEVIAGADWIIDLGPDGGDGGGEVLYQGPVEGLLGVARSPTARCLERWVKAHAATTTR